MNRQALLLVAGALFVIGFAAFPQFKTLSPNSVAVGSINPLAHPLDIWVIEFPTGGGTVLFLYEESLKNYRVGFYMYNSNWQLLGHDSRLDELKPHFGTVGGGRYYLVVAALYTQNYTVSYKLGCAFTTDTRYLSAGQTTTYKATIVGNTITWLFLLDRDEDFDPDIHVYYQGREVGTSTNEEDLDYIIWEISNTTQFEVRIVSSRGSGYYWIMILTYHKSI